MPARHLRLAPAVAALALAACGANGAETDVPPSGVTPVTTPTPSPTPSPTPQPTVRTSPCPSLMAPALATDAFCTAATLHPGPQGVEIADLIPGSGAAAASGQVLDVQYTGWLASTGAEFDSSRTRNQPFSFTLGQRQVITGWDAGLVGMRVGGKRRLVIPAALAYGKDGRPPTIPGNAALVFDIQLASIAPPTPAPGATTTTPGASTTTPGASTGSASTGSATATTTR